MTISTKNYALIVGDCFRGCSKVEGIYTVSTMAEKLKIAANGVSIGSDLPQIVKWGQGICAYDRDYLRDLIAKLPEGVLCAELPSRTEIIPATRTHVHKSASQNMLICVPARVDESLYAAELFIDPRNEFLLDHTTGQHVQGMLLIEAIRQMFLAVTEEYLLDDISRTETYFVIKSMVINFLAFIFPMDATVLFNLKSIKRYDNGRTSIIAKISILQCDVACLESDVAYSVFDSRVLESKELALADACRQWTLNEFLLERATNTNGTL